MFLKHLARDFRDPPAQPRRLHHPRVAAEPHHPACDLVEVADLNPVFNLPGGQPLVPLARVVARVLDQANFKRSSARRSLKPAAKPSPPAILLPEARGPATAAGAAASICRSSSWIGSRHSRWEG